MVASNGMHAPRTQRGEFGDASFRGTRLVRIFDQVFSRVRFYGTKSRWIRFQNNPIDLDYLQEIIRTL